MKEKKPGKQSKAKTGPAQPKPEPKRIVPRERPKKPIDREELNKLIKKRLTQLSTLFLILFILVILLGSILATQDFLCSSCHAVKETSEALQESTHKKISCFACHNDRGYLSWLTIRVTAARNLIKALTGDYELPLNARVDMYRCIYCHPSTLEKVNESSSIRVSHYEFTKAGYNCAECHGDVAHPLKGIVRNTPNMDRCLTCHDNNQAPAGCPLCHLEDVWRKTTFSLGSPFQIAHAPGQERKLHGMLDQEACIVCHDNEFCYRCHASQLPHPEDWLKYHGILSGKSSSDCYTCHNKGYCNTCHTVPMPHPDNYIEDHGDNAEDVGEQLCLACHVKETCNFCHTKSVHRFLGGKYLIENGRVIRKEAEKRNPNVEQSGGGLP